MFNPKRFKNLDGDVDKKTFKDMMRWRKERKNKVIDLSELISQSEAKEIDFLKENRSDATITWIGHATFLIQIDGLNILTDPVFAKKMGFQNRLTDPGIELKDLPEIDAVVISHGHYDHLDFPTLKNLKGNPLFLVPIGLKHLFTKKGFHHTVELNWWDTYSYHSIAFTFVPAKHWTRRGPFDMNTSHWGGWIIGGTKTKKTVYFVGDTGYFDGFKQIGAKYNIDYVLMPIGAYEPEWFMKASHINPEDAVKAFTELGATYFIPMHYGTYHLADDTGPEALRRLKTAWEKEKIDFNKMNDLKLGQTIRIENRQE